MPEKKLIDSNDTFRRDASIVKKTNLKPQYKPTNPRQAFIKFIGFIHDHLDLNRIDDEDLTNHYMLAMEFYRSVIREKELPPLSDVMTDYCTVLYHQDMTGSEIQETMNIPSQYITPILKDLYLQGLVYSYMDKSRKYYALTKFGRNFIEKTAIKPISEILEEAEKKGIEASKYTELVQRLVRIEEEKDKYDLP